RAARCRSAARRAVGTHCAHLWATLSPRAGQLVGRPWHGRAMSHRRQLRGVELRYALTMFLFQHGPKSVEELIEALDYQCFDIPGRPSKVVSDALRHEIAHGRVVRLKRGRYGPGEMPRATEHRI